MRLRGHRGFTLTETLVVVTLVLATVAAAIPKVDSAIQANRAETALQNVKMELRRAREAAIDYRRVHTVTFTAPRTITIVRVETGGNPNVQVSQMNLPSDMSFSQNGVSSSPDSFTPSGAIDFSGANSVNFNPDGSAVTAAGQICNGIVFVARPGDASSTRAATLFGSTGRIRGFRYAQTNGTWGWH